MGFGVGLRWVRPGEAQPREHQGSSGKRRGGPGTFQEPQGRPRSSPEMSSASFRKIWFFGPGRRLGAPEGPKIAGGPRWGSAPLSRKGASLRVFKLFPSAPSRLLARCESFLLLASKSVRYRLFFDSFSLQGPLAF